VKSSCCEQLLLLRYRHQESHQLLARPFRDVGPVGVEHLELGRVQPPAFLLVWADAELEALVAQVHAALQSAAVIRCPSASSTAHAVSIPAFRVQPVCLTDAGGQVAIGEHLQLSAQGDAKDFVHPVFLQWIPKAPGRPGA
jgi:hypothetical protein